MRSCEQRYPHFTGSTMCRSRVAKPQRLCAYLFKYDALSNHLNKTGCYNVIRKGKDTKNPDKQAVSGINKAGDSLSKPSPL